VSGQSEKGGNSELTWPRAGNPACLPSASGQSRRFNLRPDAV
jgi:hypothetical protein